jgi:hypothetical protein
MLQRFVSTRESLAFKPFVSTRNCSGSRHNTLFKPKTAVTHAPTLCFNQKLESLSFKPFVSTRNCSGSRSNTSFQPEAAVVYVATLFLQPEAAVAHVATRFLQPVAAVAHAPTLVSARKCSGSYLKVVF